MLYMMGLPCWNWKRRMNPTVGIHDFGRYSINDAIDRVPKVLFSRYKKGYRNKNYNSSFVVKTKDYIVYPYLIKFQKIFDWPKEVQHGYSSEVSLIRHTSAAITNFIE